MKFDLAVVAIVGVIICHVYNEAKPKIFLIETADDEKDGDKTLNKGGDKDSGGCDGIPCGKSCGRHNGICNGHGGCVSPEENPCQHSCKGKSCGDDCLMPGKYGFITDTSGFCDVNGTCDIDSHKDRDFFACPSNLWKCQSGCECIYKDERCNGHEGCEDASDEFDCEDYVCPSYQWKCQSGTQCIHGLDRCDGHKHCPDGSDEVECVDYVCQLTTFPLVNRWKCQSGTCIDGDNRCNGDNDCADGSDEDDCADYVCPAYRFKCQTGTKCINEYLRCNGVNNCEDGSDEVVDCDRRG